MDTIVSTHRRLSRWFVLCCVTLITFSFDYFYDIFSGIKGILEIQLSISSSEYGILLASFSMANLCGMVLFGGIILDKLGSRIAGLLFIMTAITGAFLVACGGSDFMGNRGVLYQIFDFALKQYSPQLKAMIVGRMLFGFGLETTCILLQKIIVKWFKNSGMAFAFAIDMGLGRLGSAVAIMAMPVLAGTIVDGRYPRFPGALWISFSVFACCFFCYLIYILFDIYVDRLTKQRSNIEAEEKFRFSDLKILLSNKRFILITLICVCFYSAVIPFMSYATDFLVNKFGYTLQFASRITSLLPIGSIVFTIIFGKIVDEKGKCITLMLWGALLLIISFLLLSLTYLPPLIGLILLGVAFSIVPSALWPAVARIVNEHRLGTAYGVLLTLQNYGLAFFFWLIGKVLDVTNPHVTAKTLLSGNARYNYTTAILLLVLLGGLGLVFTCLLKREDRHKHMGLELPFNTKKPGK